MLKNVLGYAGVGLGALLVVLITVLAIWGIAAVIILIGWNLIVPTLFHGPVIEFQQAFGAAILVSVLRGIFQGLNKN